MSIKDLLICRSYLVRKRYKEICTCEYENMI